MDPGLSRAVERDERVQTLLNKGTGLELFEYAVAAAIIAAVIITSFSNLGTTAAPAPQGASVRRPLER